MVGLDPRFCPKNRDFCPKTPKNPEKWQKNPKIKGFLTLFWVKNRKTHVVGDFWEFPRKPGFRIGSRFISANLDSL